MPRSAARRALTPSATILSASISKPESVSSKTANFGCSIAICKISLRFFSPPEKPSFTDRSIIDLSMPNLARFTLSKSRNSDVLISGSPRYFRAALIAALRKYLLLTPGISTGYW